MKWRRRKTRHADLEREIRSDLELEEEEQRERGLAPEAAHYAARRAFGNTLLIREQTHEAWGWTSFVRLQQDIHYALRQLKRSPGFAFICLVTLSLGIGANTAVFSVIEAVLLHPLPYPESHRLLLLTDPEDPQDGGLLLNDIEAYRRENRTFEDIAAYYRDSGWSRVTLTGSQEPVSIQGGFVSANLFSILGVSPQLGRTFTTEEETHRERVAVLSYRLWQQRFGGSPDVAGQSIHMNGAAFKVIGVMPAAFAFPAADVQLWVPITTNRYWGDASALVSDGSQSRGFYTRWQAVARLKDRISTRQAQAEVNTLFHGLETASRNPNRGSGIKALPLGIQVSGDTRLALHVLFASVFLLLLIACGNVANLILARGAARTVELALREVLGATPGRILRQMFTEAVVLGLLSGLLSLPLALLGTRALVQLAPGDIPRLQQAGVNLSVLGFTFAVTMLCAVFFGLVPAFALPRSSPAEKIKAGTTTASAPGGVMGLLIIFETALSVVLLTCAGLLIHSFLIVRAVDPGFEAEHVMKLNVSLPGGSAQWPSNLYDTIVDRLRAVPSVRAVGAIDGLFNLGATNNLGLRAIEGRAPEAHSQWTALTWDTVRGDYFDAMGAQLIRGRYFSDSDNSESPLVAVIDESTARRYWPGQDALGQRFKGQDRRGRNDDWLTVVGVVRDMHTHGLERAATPHVYEWYRQSGNATADIVVRTVAEPALLANSVRMIVRSVAPGAILSEMTTVNQELQLQLAPRRFQTALLGVFSLLALFLATVGVYGLMHYSVVQRTREIGVRVALGADRSSIIAMVVRQSLLLAVVGLVVGMGLNWMATRAFSKLLYGIHAFDPFTLLAVCLTLLGASAIASFYPALKAASIDPMQALRTE